MSNFCHLHSHTEASLLDGMSRVEEMIPRAIELGMSAIGITDHGFASAPFRAWQYLKKKKIDGFQVIMGLEAYFTEDRTIIPQSTKEIRESLTDYGSEEEKEEAIGEEKARQKNFHLTLLVKNQTGYTSMMRLLHASWQPDGVMPSRFGMGLGTPRVDWDLLTRFHAGLICLSGCSNGPLARAILQEDEALLSTRARRFRDLFGEDYYMELMPLEYSKQPGINQGVFEVGQRLSVPHVVTSDAHYLTKGDAETHEVLLCIQTKSKMSEPPRHEGGKRFSLSERDYWVKSREEMEAAARKHTYLSFPLWVQGLDRTGEIAEKIDFVPREELTSFPDFVIEDEEFLESR